jgi:hypothetical protein
MDSVDRSTEEVILMNDRSKAYEVAAIAIQESLSGKL